MKRLFELRNIAGVKDATGNLARVSLQRHELGPDFIQLSGEDMTALAYLGAGGHGCISVTANVAPRQCAALQDAALAGDYRTALGHQDRLVPLHAALFVEPNPAGPKYGLSLLAACGRRGPAADDAARRSGQGRGARGHDLRGLAQRLIAPIETTSGDRVAKDIPVFKNVSENRRARYNYEIGDTYEAGLVLTGTEVKSLRTGKATIAESYASAEKGELFLDQRHHPGL